MITGYFHALERFILFVIVAGGCFMGAVAVVALLIKRWRDRKQRNLKPEVTK